MRRFLVYAGISFCLLLISLYIFRMPLSLMVADHYLTQEQGELTCLEWSIAGFTKVDISKACLLHTQANITAKEVTVTPDALLVEHLQIEHITEPSAQQSKPLQKLLLPLVENRPLLTIKDVNIKSPQLQQPLSFSINESELNRFRIDGDVSALVALLPDQISVETDLSSQGFKPYLPTQIKALSGLLSFTFDGVEIDSRANLQASILDASLADCHMMADIKGGLVSQLNLNLLLANVDLSKLQVKINGKSCRKLTDFQQSLPAEVVSTDWQLFIPEPFTATLAKVEIPSLSIKDQNGVTDIALKNLRLAVPKKSALIDINLSHQNPQFGWLEIQAKLSAKGNHVSTSGDWLLSSAALNLVNEVAIEDLVSQGEFTLVGMLDQNINLELATQTSMGELKNTQVLLNNTELNLSTRLSADLSILAADPLQAFEVDVFDTQVSVERYRFEEALGKHIWLESKLNTDELKHFKGQLNMDVGSFKRGELRGKDVSQSMTFKGELANVETSIHFDGETHLGLVATPQLSFRNAVVTSSGNFNEQFNLDHVLHLEELEVLIKHKVGPQLNEVDVSVPEQSFLTLQPIIQQFDPKIQLSEGTISANISGDVSEQSYHFDMTLEEGGILYDSHYLSGLNMPITGMIKGQQLVIEESPIGIREIRSGAVLENFQASLSSYDSKPMLSNISAYIFDGQLSAQQISLSEEDQSFLVEAQDWELAVIAHAAKNAGVELSGRVYGQLPVTVVDGALEIHGGKLNNIDVGLLSIENNQSVEALKAQQPSLETAFGMLERLNIEKLTSDVNMSSDGWLDLAVQITGVNEQQGQPINFNYTHKENIFQLFRALRLSDEITKEVEKALN
ncbi:YdbH domain-containing protein [Pseudoalteromonas umbrosa]|uniref:YdbH domain-containing protein n=1 Tax=Pseudoalteromonas umbrosa TaxID=3048489 RepID=UPI0024C2D254|nr:YdbH domain-containing protein [Pseudoalteromonas sp. B95]MDK1289228.1 YdbH domain-containing protein [Pseudoalteromonas sp. B95]